LASVPAVAVSFDLAEGYALRDAVRGIEKASTKIGVPPAIQGPNCGAPTSLGAVASHHGATLR